MKNAWMMRQSAHSIPTQSYASYYRYWDELFRIFYLKLQYESFVVWLIFFVNCSAHRNYT